MQRFLITTALENTWRDDVPVLFLGEWCRRHDRRETWQGLDAEVVPYHWDDREKLFNDYQYLRELYEVLLAELAGQLNKAHGVSRSVRYWRILIGPWLGYFVQMLFDRWAMLRKALREFEISGVKIVSSDKREVVPNDMEDFHELFVTDCWNEAIYGELVEWMNVPIERISGLPQVQASASGSSGGRFDFKRKLRQTLGKALSNLSAITCSEDEYFFISSYLPERQSFALQWKLDQLPKRWRPIKAPMLPADHVTRVKDLTAPHDVNDFLSVVRLMIRRHMPTAYREGYCNLVAVTRRLPWPKRPKAIFTSNSYSADDVFKAWAAEKVANGAPLIIGQHGGNFGMARWSFAEEHQMAIADRFLTWGWRQADTEKVTPVGNLKGFGSKVAIDRQGVAILVEMTVPRNSYHMFSAPAGPQWLDYFEDQCRFVQALSPELRGQLLVRPYARDYDWCQKQRWRERFPLILVDDGVRSMTSLINKSRLYISTYNATTYLESLSLNIPTIMFWNPKHWELRDSAIPAFEELRSVGIFHETPESAARQMTQVWNDIDAWWQSESIQRVRRKFCERYAHIPEDPLGVMEKVFRDVATANASVPPISSIQQQFK